MPHSETQCAPKKKGMDPNALNGLSSQFGIINSLRTGNVVVDMVICMMIPVAFKVLSAIWERFQPAFLAFIESLRTNNNVVLKTLDYEVIYSLFNLFL
jgi:hypothetical protein